MKKHLKYQAMLSIITVLLLLMSFSAATYAWFTGSPDVNVTPMEGKIGSAGGSLLISDRRDGVYDKTCNLTIQPGFAGLVPISTADLGSFFAAKEQSTEDLIVSFIPADDRVEAETIHGHVYLKAEHETCKVYLDPAELDFGSDVQALAALRLGLRITGENGTADFIFRMDGFHGLALTEAEKQTTVQGGDAPQVVGKAAGGWALVPDPAQTMADYCAVIAGEEYSEGAKELCTIEEGRIADVEYWLYLEGCDENCINVVQLRDAALQLGFYGAEQVQQNPEN